MLKTTILSAVALAVTNAENILFCGTAPFYPSQYTCYDKFLCPIINGEPTLKCGNACYLPEAYKCEADVLQQQNTPAALFTLTVINSPLESLNGLNVSACGQALFINDAGCPYCPDFLASSGGCTGFTNTTVFYQGLSLDVAVPGGQAGYMLRNGAIGYTQAHSAYQPDNATFVNAVAYSEGYLTTPADTYGWMACLQANPSEYQLYARIGGVGYPSSCYSVNLKVNDVPQGTIGAWQWE